MKKDLILELLEDIVPGDYVQLTYGEGAIHSAEGRVMKMTENVIKLETTQGTTRIIVDNIESVNTLNQPVGLESAPVVAPVSVSTAPVSVSTAPVSVSTAPVSVPTAPVSVSTAPNSPAPPPIGTQHLEYDRVTFKSKLKENLKKSQNEELKNKLNGLLDSMEGAIKCRQLPHKLHDLKAKGLSHFKKAKKIEDLQLCENYIAFLTTESEDYSAAMESWLHLKNYEMAAYSAEKLGQQEKCDEFRVCMALADPTGDCLDTNLSSILLKQQTIAPLQYLLDNQPLSTEKLSKLVSLLWTLGQSVEGGNLPLPTLEGTDFDQANHWLKAFPTSWAAPSKFVGKWQEYEGFTYPNQERIGRVESFFHDKCFGYLQGGQKLFFHISQVEEDDFLLRKALCHQKYHGIEVKYLLGENSSGVAATDISLTEDSRRDLEKIFSISNGLDTYTGDVTSYNADHGVGTILVEKQKFKFHLRSVVDPRLAHYYKEAFYVKEQRVCFTLGEHQGQTVAVNIHAKNRDELEEPVQITPQDQQRWEDFLKYGPENQAQGSSDPYGSFSFYSLPFYEERLSSSGNKVPTSTGTSSQVVRSLPVKRSVTNEYTPLYEKAHRFLSNNDLENAEIYYRKCIEQGKRIESSVADLIGIFLRQENRAAEANGLLEQYEGDMDATKVLNLRITICQKNKEYEELSRLYQEAIRFTTKPATRAHYYINMAAAQRACGEFKVALQTYHSWHDLSAQYRNTQEGSKMKNQLPAIQRGEAICHYFLGNYEQADTLAKELVRLNPSDETSISILERSLSLDDSSEKELVLTETSTVFEEFDHEDAQLNEYLQYRIAEVDVVTLLRSEHIINDTYTGELSQAEHDINRLLEKSRGSSAQHRSDAFLAAARLLDLLPVGNNRPDSLNEEKKCSYAGRAMAVWGDYATGRLYQLDTPRFAYLTALHILRKDEQGWQDALNRYLRSFYWSIEELQQYVIKQSKSSRKDPANIQFLSNSELPQERKYEFSIGMLSLWDPHLRLGKHQETFETTLFTHYNQLLSQQISSLLEESIPQADNIKEFRQLMQKAYQKLEDNKRDLKNLLEKFAKNLLDTETQEENLSKLTAIYSKNWMNIADQNRLREVESILGRAKDYKNSNSFEHLSSCYNESIARIDTLIDLIIKEPTDISFHLFKPMLEVVRSKLNDERQELYSDSSPKLTWEITTMPYSSTAERYCFHLTMQNERNCQRPDTLQFPVLKGEGIDDCKLDHSSTGETEFIISGVPTKEALSARSFTFSFKYSYRYNNTAQESVREELEEHFTLYIHGERKCSLENPFSNYVAQAMTEKNMFFGREDEINSLIEMIYPKDSALPKYGHGVALYGQTRTGKSSILFHFKDRLKELLAHRVLIWDIGNVADLFQDGFTIGDFYYTVLNVIEPTLRENQTLWNMIQEEELVSPAELILNDAAHSQTRFANYMRRLNTIIRAHPDQLSAVMIIDEFSYFHTALKNEDAPKEFMKSWKAYLQNYGIIAVISGQDDMPQFMREYPNEFASMDLVKVTALKEIPSKELVYIPLERANHQENMIQPREETLDKLYRLTAGSAYLTMCLCKCLVDFMNEKGAPVVTPAIIENALETSILTRHGLTEVNFEPQLHDRSCVGQEVINKSILLSVARLCKRTEYASESDICHGTKEQFSEADVLSALARLVDRDVLIFMPSRGYRIEVELLARFLLATCGG